jgi:hypothetical protein
MSALAKNTSLSTRNGGNATYYVQLKYDAASDKFVAATEADVYGEAAGTVHVLGNQEESTFPRKDDGSYEFDFTIMEQDAVRQNMLELVAPVADANDEDEEVFMEDGTKIGGGTAQYDSTKPVFAFWTRLADLGGKARYRHYIGQFAPAGGLKGQKAKQRNRLSFKVNSINSKASTAVAVPDTDDFPEFTGVSATALTSPYLHGKVVTAS